MDIASKLGADEHFFSDYEGTQAEIVTTEVTFAGEILHLGSEWLCIETADELYVRVDFNTELVDKSIKTPGKSIVTESGEVQEVVGSVEEVMIDGVVISA